jgi:hypothetical protein
MNQPPDMKRPRPAHLCPLTVDIPRTWTPEQALAVFELVSDIRDAIWTIYDCRLQALLREQSGDCGPDHSCQILSDTPF